MTEEVVICTVGGTPMYGTPHEAAILRLGPGSQIRFRGVIEAVKFVWFYDGPVVETFSGTTIFDYDFDKVELQ